LVRVRAAVSVVILLCLVLCGSAAAVGRHHDRGGAIDASEQFASLEAIKLPPLPKPLQRALNSVRIVQTHSFTPPPLPRPSPEFRPVAARRATHAQVVASRTAYTHMQEGGAASLARSTFPSLVGRAANPRLKLRSGQRVLRYTNEHTAQVRLANGKHAVIASNVPMVARTSSGAMTPVDLGLTASASSFHPRHAALPLDIPTHLQDGVSLPGIGVRLTPVDGTGAALHGDAGKLDGATVLFADTQTDTDTLVKPTPSGVETVTMVRSQRSPEQFDFKLSVPSHATIRATGGRAGGVVVVRGGKTIAAIPWAVATDASGASVPLDMKLVGHELRLTIRHRSGSWQYPIAVDPTVVDQGTVFDVGNWVFTTDNPSAFLGGGGTIGDESGSPYSPGQFGLWSYYTQGVSRIYQFNATTDQGSGNTSPAVRTLVGIANSAGWEGSQWLPDGNFNNYATQVCAGSCAPTSGTAGNAAVWEQAALASGIWWNDSLESYQVYIAQDQGPSLAPDTTDPTFNGSPNPNLGGWVSGGSIPFTASDPGIGIYGWAFQTYPTASLGWTGEKPFMDGDHEDCADVQCDEQRTIYTYVGNLPDGIDTVQASVENATGATATALATVHVDKSAPTVALSGSLATARGGQIGAGTYNLTATIQDGTSTTPSSGVASASISIDGQQVWSNSTGCAPGPCSITGMASMTGANYAQGNHEIDITSTDRIGNTSTRAMFVKVYTPASTSVGPGKVDLSSGELSLGEQDVDIAGSGSLDLTLGRTYLSNHLTMGARGPLGPQWEMTFPNGLTGGDWQSLTQTPLGFVAENSDGVQVLFPSNGSGYSSPPGYPGTKLTGGIVQVNNQITIQYRITDASGEVTTFGSNPQAPSALTLSSVTVPGAGNQTTYTFETMGGITRPRQILAPVPTGVTCTTLVRGCRALTFTYATSTTASGDTASGWGDYSARLSRINLTAYDPSAGAMRTTAVAQYSYDAEGKLRAESDPRISPSLKTTYDYDAAGHVTSDGSPGQEPYEFNYRSLTGDQGTGRLRSVTRFDPTLNQTATWTVAYHVPLSGSGAPYAMGSSDVAAWSQTDDPANATAIFPADEVPSATPSDYDRATIYYLDDLGRNVNVARPGGRISTTEYDDDNNTVRTLSPSNRARSLEDGSSSAATSQTLDTQYTYSSSATELMRVLSPEHTIAFNATPASDTVSGGLATDSPHGTSTGTTTISTVFGNATCRDAQMTVRDGHLTRLAFDNGATSADCALSGTYAGVCTVNVSAPGLPYAASIATASGQRYDSTLTINGFSLQVAFHCGTSTINCAYAPTGGSPLVAGIYGADNRSKPSRNAGQVADVNTTLTATVTGSLCATTSQWNATYAVTSTSDPGSAAGEQVDARQDTRYTYDEGAPSGGTYGLVTTETEGASVDGGSDRDVRTTTTQYGGQSSLGWTLREPTSTTSDAGGRNVVHTTLYDATTGNVTETRQPANPNGGDAHATQTIYYSAAANATVPACGNHPEWANLVCQSRPAAQPGTAGLPDLETTTYQYNMLDEPTTVTDTSGSATRTTTKGYDGAGRVTTESITSSTGDARPSVTDGYDAATGLPTTQTTSDATATRTITTAYDALGRVTSYTDADGNTATESYDIDSRLVRSDDDRGTQLYTYDRTTGDLASLQDSSVGTFTAQYDAEGNMTKETFPNGMDADYVFDSENNPVRLTYVKTRDCSTDCVWYDDQATPSIHSEWLTQRSSLSSQAYTYDGAGELSEVDDTEGLSGCTARTYDYDADGNRARSVTHDPRTDGSCDPSSNGTAQTHSYDAGDRLTDSGVSYDTFGNTLSLPAADAGGSSLTATYYVDNTLHTASQDGRTIAYALDPAGRVRERTVSGDEQFDEVDHFDDGSDSPSWTDDGGGYWTRNISGIDGDLVATQQGGHDATLELVNLHGDVIGEAALDPTATAPTKLAESTEFGAPQTSASFPLARFAWLGGQERSTELPSGLVAMGARAYVPQVGRFLQPDPVSGGSSNAYDYARGDPVNMSDVQGTYTPTVPSWLTDLAAQTAARAASDYAALQAATRPQRARAMPGFFAAFASGAGTGGHPMAVAASLFGGLVHGLTNSLKKGFNSGVRFVKRNALKFASILSDQGSAAAGFLALSFGAVPCFVGGAGAGPVAPLVWLGCGAFAAGNAGIIGYSEYDSFKTAKSIH
jgi:RHS repeat-associated protein